MVGLKHRAISFIVLLFLCIASRGSPAGTRAGNPPAPRVRTYYVAADEVVWDYVPPGRNLTGTPGPEIEGRSNQTTYRKAVYHEYTDATFNVLKPRPPEWEHLGILGPLIRAEVVDTIKVVFKNNTKIFESSLWLSLSSMKPKAGTLKRIQWVKEDTPAI